MKQLSIRYLTVVWCCVAAASAFGQTPLLKQLAQEDQDSRTGKSVPRTDEDRIKLVLELIAKGSPKGPEDQFDAAVVLQHTSLTLCDGKLVSMSPDNYLMAHYLFIGAYDGGYKDARYLIAASIDRYLSFTAGYQKYGTNRVSIRRPDKRNWSQLTARPAMRNGPNMEFRHWPNC